MGLFGKYFENITKPSGRSSIFYSHRLVTFAGPSKLRYLSKVYSKMLEAALSFGGDIYLSDGIFAWGRVIGWIRDKKLLTLLLLQIPVIKMVALILQLLGEHMWHAGRLLKHAKRKEIFRVWMLRYTGAAIRSFLGNDFQKVDSETIFG